MPVTNVVVLVLENRSFDEYFGTFPGVDGFFSGAATLTQQWPGYPSGVTPFRLSTYSAVGESLPSFSHLWGAQHDAWSSQDSGWAAAHAKERDGVDSMGYFAADDIPYHWALASAFLLCDNYHCSVLGPTLPNRTFLMAGAIFDPATGAPDRVLSTTRGSDNPYIYNEAASFGWKSYATMLAEASVPFCVFDDQPWEQPFFPVTPGGGGVDLNALNLFADGTGTARDPHASHYVATAADATTTPFEQAAAAGTLPTVSWVLPPYGASEHPPYTPFDGAAYLSRVVDAVLGSPQWPGTVLIVTYDENDGHFDHVVPPTSPDPTTVAQAENAYEPWVADLTVGSQWTLPAPIGGGFRVPCIVVSPWTYHQGVASQLMDHTSVLQFLEDVTGVSCPNLPPAGSPGSWRRATFGNLGSVIDTTSPPITAAGAIGVPDHAAAIAFRAGALARAEHLKSLKPVPTPTPGGAWPPVVQAASLRLEQPPPTLPPTFPATLSGVLNLVCGGFEPAELNLGPDAVPGSVPITPIAAAEIAGEPTTAVTVRAAGPASLLPDGSYQFPLDLEFTASVNLGQLTILATLPVPAPVTATLAWPGNQPSDV